MSFSAKFNNPELISTILQGPGLPAVYPRISEKCALLSQNIPLDITSRDLLILFAPFNIVRALVSFTPGAQQGIAILFFKTPEDRDKVFVQTVVKIGSNTCHLSAYHYYNPSISHIPHHITTPLLISVSSNPSPQDPAYVRFVCLSDTHGQHNEMIHSIPAGDVLLFAGDFTMLGRESTIHSFLSWLDGQPFKTKIIIGGNHELTLHRDAMLNNYPEAKEDANTVIAGLVSVSKKHCTYLEHEQLEVEGFNLFATPYSAGYPAYAFHQILSEQRHALWQTLPDNIDILMTHGPPLNILDFAADRTKPLSNIHAGDQELRDRVAEINPLVHLFGHIHEAHGVSSEGGILFINAAICDVEKKPTHKPIVFDLPRKGTPQWCALVEKAESERRRARESGYWKSTPDSAQG